jgi:hypothetical protein
MEFVNGGLQVYLTQRRGGAEGEKILGWDGIGIGLREIKKRASLLSARLRDFGIAWI